MRIAMVPVRKGSERLSSKNYKLLGDFTIFEHAILKCKKTNLFDVIYLNSEDKELKSFAEKHQVNFFGRNPTLANSSATADQVVLNMINNIIGNYLAMRFIV